MKEEEPAVGCPEPHPPRAWTRLDEAVMERAAALFGALGDVGRLRILQQLAQGEACVSEIAEELDEGMSTVSQRLKLLRQERLVRRRRDGKHHFYALADEHVARLVENALEHVQHDTDSR